MTDAERVAFEQVLNAWLQHAIVIFAIDLCVYILQPLPMPSQCPHCRPGQRWCWGVGWGA
jgi:hypothetical protein